MSRAEDCPTVQDRRTWVESQLERNGDRGWHDVVSHILAVYHPHLVSYVRHLRWRDPRISAFGEPDQIAGDFLSDFLATRDGITRWLDHKPRKTLRGWLVNGLHFNLRPQLRRLRRTHEVPLDDVLLSSLSSDELSPILELAEQTFAEAVIREAFRAAEKVLQDLGRGDDWRVFVGYYCRGVSYRELGAEVGVSEVLARTKMARRARETLRELLREWLVRDGLQEDEVDVEISRLLELGMPVAYEPQMSADSLRPEALTRLLELGWQDRPLDGLLERLGADESGAASHHVLQLVQDKLNWSPRTLVEVLIKGPTPVEELQELKGRGKALFHEGGDHNCDAGLLAYHLSIAAALCAHRVFISTRPRLELNTSMRRLAMRMQDPWRAMLLEATRVPANGDLPAAPSAESNTSSKEHP